MRCSVCGCEMRDQVTDLPFKTSDSTIVILKGLPVLQCVSCKEYLIPDEVMERVDLILRNTSATAELEIVRYAA